MNLFSLPPILLASQMKPQNETVSLPILWLFLALIGSSLFTWYQISVCHQAKTGFQYIFAPHEHISVHLRKRGFFLDLLKSLSPHLNKNEKGSCSNYTQSKGLFANFRSVFYVAAGKISKTCFYSLCYQETWYTTIGIKYSSSFLN